jgi:hypothetical protein
MSAASKKAPELIDHLAWLGYIQPEGLVVSAPALVASQVVIDRAGLAALQERFAAHVTTLHLDDRAAGDSAAGIPELTRLFTDFLEWPADLLVGWDPAHPVSEGLSVPLPEFQETLRPTYALAHAQPKAGESPWLLLVQAHPPSTDLTKPTAAGERGWSASPAKKFERLLRETGVPIGLLTNGVSFQLVYAPPKENSGTLTFNVGAMTEISGRLILGAFHLLLNSWTLLSAPTPQRLPALLQTSRSYQASVSEKLAEQVLHALYELLRGFVAAEQQAKSQRLHDLATRRPEDIYGGLVTVLLRLVFVLFAEDRALLPTKGLFVKHYSVRGLFERLRADAERYPDTMEHRFGAWAQLLALFRLIHGGCQHEEMRMPAREGHLFDFNRYPFLEGRSHRDDPVGALPLVSDGVIYGILEKLCVLEGERVSYRTLDVEEIGSVYQTIMGFGVEVVAGTAIALKGKRKKGAVPAAAVVDLEALLELKPADRIKHLAEQAETKLPAEAEKQVKAAERVDDLLAALGKRIDDKATPSAVAKGGLVLQPNDERRRSGSHYTPRSFTEPIVRKTLEPVLARLVSPVLATVPTDKSPTPAQILDLKVADIAVGSAAFLVEACRQIGDALVKAWRVHGGRPPVPPDETEELLAMRLVAQRCLYGVDRNPMAVDLAKLSLWLATLAKDHPFTFLDHNLRCGDSLVGLTQKQIEAFTWEEKTAGKQRILGQDFLEKRIKAATAYRRDILEGGDYVLPSLKAAKLKLADEALDEVRFAGDLIISAFFSAEKNKTRIQNLEHLRERYVSWHASKTFDPALKPREEVAHLRTGKTVVVPFHWEIEFPEVFSRTEGGFDAIIGNPPFAGHVTATEGNRPGYTDFLRARFPESGGKCDIVAFFFRKAFDAMRPRATLGLIATNTIGQGDTRFSGLRWICNHGGQIYAAHKRVRWPGQAAVIVSLVYITRGNLGGLFDLDGRKVPLITAYLFHEGGNENPASLNENSSKGFQGSVVRGMGFTFDDTDKKGVASSTDEMRRLIKLDARNAERIQPFIGGEEVNDSPTHAPHRFIINFGELSETEAKKWPDLFEITRTRVLPERKDSTAKTSSGKILDEFWRFGHTAKELYSQISSLDRVMVISQVSAHHAFTYLPVGMVYSHALNVFTLPANASFCVLQSRPHELWAHFFASSLEDRLRYTPTDCFETFPFPANHVNNANIEGAGSAYYEFRAGVMKQHNEGLTKTYNRFHDPDETSPTILKLRELHATMDRAVLDAYGWTDITADCDFFLEYEDAEDVEVDGKARKRKKPWRYRWPDAVRDEVLARLLKLNAERAEQERLAGEAASPCKPAKKPATGAKRGRKPKAEPIGAVSPARQLPTDLRLAENIPGLYAVGLVVALLSEAGGTLLAAQLIDAFALATQPDQMTRLAPPEYEAAAKEWAAMWNEQATPHDLLPALDNLTSANIAVERTTLGIEFSLQDGPKSKLPPHLAYDAWLALRVAETLEPSAALVTGAELAAFTAKLELLTA